MGGVEGDPGHVLAGRRPWEGEVLSGGGGHVVPHHWLGGVLGSWIVIEKSSAGFRYLLLGPLYIQNSKLQYCYALN